MLSAAHAWKLCAKNLASVRSLFGSKHYSTSNRRRPEAAKSEQRHAHCSAAAPTAARSRWGRMLVYATAGAAGVGGCSLAVASGGDPAHARAVLAAVPRTANAIRWVCHSSLEYSRVTTAHPGRAGEDYDSALQRTHQLCADRLLALCQANGSLYVKAAQFATTIPSVPAPYRRTLEVLQDQVTPQPFDEINGVLQREFQADASELFAEFEETATAAASLAQVHRARLLNGEEVAVKVQYAGLESAVAADLATFAGLATIAGLAFPDFKLGWVVQDLRKTLAQELDFRQEAANSRALAAAVARNPSIAVPRVHDALSNQRVIVMEWVSGAKVSDKAGMVAMGLRPLEVGCLLMRTFAEMAFERGCVHADPHPGNILVRPQPAGSQGWLARRLRGGRSAAPQLVLLDHGSYVRLGEELRRKYCQLWCAFVLNDAATARQVSHAIGGERVAALLPLLMKPGALGKMPKKQRERLKQETGLSSLGDVQQLVELMPRPLAQYLRISAVIRATSAALGCTIHDRLRVNATAALEGLSIQHNDGRTEFIGDLNSRSKRLQLWGRVYVMRWLAWTVHGWHLFTSRWSGAPA